MNISSLPANLHKYAEIIFLLDMPIKSGIFLNIVFYKWSIFRTNDVTLSLKETIYALHRICREPNYLAHMVHLLEGYLKHNVMSDPSGLAPVCKVGFIR